MEENGGTLSISVIAARNLVSRDGFLSGSAPFCKISCNFNRQRFRTRHINKTTNPEWNTTFKFYTTQLQDAELYFKIYNKGWTRDSSLGDMKMSLGYLNDGKPLDKWYWLQNEPKSSKKSNQGKPPGELRIVVLYILPKEKEESFTLSDFQATEAIQALTTPLTTLSVTDVYEIGRQLGKGSFSVVHECTHKTTG